MPTRGAALAEAAERAPFAIAGPGTRSSARSFTRRSPARTSSTTRPPTGSSREYKNGEFASFGACARPDPDRRRGPVRLRATAASRCSKLSGPAQRRSPARTVTVRVTDAGNGDRSPARRVGRRHDRTPTAAPPSARSPRGGQTLQGDQGRHGPLQPPAAVRDRRLRRRLRQRAAVRRPTRPRRPRRSSASATASASRAAARRASCAARSRADPSGPVGGQDPPHPPARRHVLVLLRQPRAVPQAHLRQAVRVQGRRPRGAGATCCPRACRAAATCSAPTRSTTPFNHGRARAGWCSASDEARCSSSPLAARSPCPPRRAAAEVDVMVVGKERVLRAPADVRLKVRTVDGRRPALPRRRRDAALRAGRPPSSSSACATTAAAASGRATRPACT